MFTFSKLRDTMMDVSKDIETVFAAITERKNVFQFLKMALPISRKRGVATFAKNK